MTQYASQYDMRTPYHYEHLILDILITTTCVFRPKYAPSMTITIHNTVHSHTRIAPLTHLVHYCLNPQNQSFRPSV